MYSLGFSIIRWQSRGRRVTLRRLATTGGPRVMLGTKWPSITSTWMVVPPPRSAAAIWSARWAKSAERMEGSSSTIAFGATPCELSVSSQDCDYGSHRFEGAYQESAQRIDLQFSKALDLFRRQITLARPE